MCADDKIGLDRPSEIPEGRAIVFMEMVRQLDRGTKTFSQASVVLLDVGFTLAQVECLLAVYRDARSISATDVNHRDERRGRRGTWEMPRVASPPLISPQPFVLKRGRWTRR